MIRPTDNSHQVKPATSSTQASPAEKSDFRGVANSVKNLVNGEAVILGAGTHTVGKAAQSAATRATTQAFKRAL